MRRRQNSATYEWPEKKAKNSYLHLFGVLADLAPNMLNIFRFQATTDPLVGSSGTQEWER